MAPSKPIPARTVTQYALQKLEESVDSFSDQLDKACSILEIDLGSGLLPTQDSTPKLATYEWILRWLLKKLREPQQCESRLNPEAWIVTQFLVYSIPLSNAVKLLQANSFLEIVNSALLDILKNARRPHQDVGKEVASGDSIMSESSATLDGDVGTNQYQKSRKRKRTMTTTKSLECLFSVLGNVMRLLERLVETSHESNTGGFETASSRDHLKLVLTPDIPLAADLLAHWLQLFELSSQKGNDIKYSPLALNGIIKAPKATPILTLWSDRSTQDVDNVEKSQQSFSEKCLGPALVVIDRISDVQGLDHIKLAIEHLIVAHTIIPFRTLAIRYTKSVETSKTDNQKSLEYLLKGIRAQDQRSFSKLDDEAASSCQLFRLAITYSKRSTKLLRERDIEWLEELFIALAANHGIILSSENRADEQQCKVLELLLKVALTENLRLSTATLRIVASNFCGLNLKPPGINWTLISTIFEIDPDIFVNSLSDHSIVSESTGKKLTLLESVVEGFRFTQPATQTEEFKEIQIQKAKVAQQMLSAFVQTRNLLAFLSIWQHELTLEAQRARDNDKFMDNFESSVWTQTRLSDDLNEVLELALIPKQIDEYLEQLNLQLRFKKSGEETGALAYASLCLADLVCKSIKTEQSQEFLVGVVGKCCQTLSSSIRDWDQRYKPRVWSTLRALTNIYYNVKGNLPTQILDDLLPEATRTIKSHKICSFSKRAISHSEEYQTFLFLCSVSHQDRKTNEMIRSLLEESVATLALQIESLEDMKKPKTSKHESHAYNEFLYTRICECWSKGASTMGMIAALLTEYLAVFATLKTETRQALLASLFTTYCTAEDVESNNSEETLDRMTILPSELWLGIIDSTQICNNHDIPRQIINIAIEGIVQNFHDNNVVSSTGRRFEKALETILQLPQSSFDRKQRDFVVESVLKHLMRLEDSAQLKCLGLELAVLVKFASLIKPSSKLIKEPKHLFTLTMLVDKSTGNVEKLCTMFEKLLEMVLSSFFSLENQERGHASIKVLYENLKAQSTDMNTLLDRPGMQVLFKITTANSALAPQLTKMSELPKIIECIQLVVLTLSKKDAVSISPKSAGSKGESIQDFENFLALISALNEMSIAQNLSEANDELLRDINGILDHKLSPGHFDPTESSIHNRLDLSKLWNQPRSFEPNQIIPGETPKNVFDRDSILSQTQRLLRMYARRFELSNASQRSTVLDKLCSVVSSESVQLTDLVLVNYFVSHDSYSAEFSDLQLYKLHHSICSSFTLHVDSRIVWSKLQILDTLLHKKSPFINQWAIEKALSSIFQVIILPKLWSSRSGTASIYEQFCRILRTIFTVHLRKLRGRYHLVLPILQILLSRLFIRFEQGKQSKKTAEVAKWMFSDRQLQKASAQGFSQLLFALCEPSAQAASGSNKRADLQLTPAKDTIRNTAGQYLPTLITSYCHCQLEGRLDSEIKDGLMPGIYAVLSVSSQERLRALSAAMNSSSRAIFKSLYSDYRQYGKWKGN